LWHGSRKRRRPLGTGPLRLIWPLLLSLVSACGTLTLEQEKELGDEQVAQLNEQVSLVTARPVVGYVNQLGGELLAAAPASGYQVSFRVINSNALNAFAIAGGNIYVTTGAIVASRNSAELASILAHEIAHVRLGHIRDHYHRFRNTRTAAELTAITIALITGNPFLAGAGDFAANVGSSAYVASHSREAERDADSMAFEIMLAAGFDPRSQLTLLSRLHAASLVQDTPLPFLLSHPLPAERVEEARLRISGVSQRDTWQIRDGGSLEEIQALLLPQVP